MTFMNRKPGVLAIKRNDNSDDPYAPIEITHDGIGVARLPLDDAPVRDYNEQQAAIARRMVMVWNAHDELVVMLREIAVTDPAMRPRDWLFRSQQLLARVSS